jgi:gliding motility-associated-like protein
VYKNQAMLQNLPTELGPMRLSDDPGTPEHDSTGLEILGVETDTLIVYEILCPRNTLVLDGAPFGVDHQWYDGTRESSVEISETGIYELVVFDGCEPTYIFFDVSGGNDIEVSFDSVSYNLKLGDSLFLAPVILNSGAMLDIWWTEPFDSTMSCTRCAEAVVFPKHSADYWVFVANEHCIDSARAAIRIDNARRLFVPNIFTPDDDGLNDLVTIYSPDYGNVEELRILDRWGNILHERRGFLINDESAGWDGSARGRPAPTGTYLWQARITFLDGASQVFAGSVHLIR